MDREVEVSASETGRGGLNEEPSCEKSSCIYNLSHLNSIYLYRNIKVLLDYVPCATRSHRPRRIPTVPFHVFIVVQISPGPPCPDTPALFLLHTFKPISTPRCRQTTTPAKVDAI